MKPPKILYWCAKHKCEYYTYCIREPRPVVTTCKHSKVIYIKTHNDEEKAKAIHMLKKSINDFMDSIVPNGSREGVKNGM
jgi:hypothetical protein